jgi:short-subunit dehydrogenase
MTSRIARVLQHVTAKPVAGEFDTGVEDGNGLQVLDLFDCFEGKVCVVTGGSIGLGRMMAEGFAVNGCKVYINSRKAAACDATAAELNALCAKSGRGGSVVALPGDLSTEEGCKLLAANLEEEKIHFL